MGEQKFLDRFLRAARIRRARPFVRLGDDVLDVGCADGEMLRRWQGHIGRGVGIEPSLDEPVRAAGYELLPGRFPEKLPPTGDFDVITMLAVLEHIPTQAQTRLADACAALLRPGGKVVITVPSPRVDEILHLLIRLRLIGGMAAHEHYGFRPEQTPSLFPAPTFRLLRRQKFQLGLNNLFVFEKIG